jgi:hypothetical protein
MATQQSTPEPQRQDWAISGAYGIWRLRLSWEPDTDPEADPTPPPADPARILPQARFAHLGDHFYDLVNLHELELDMP